MKKTISLYEAVRLDELFENNRLLIYKFPTVVSWELQQFSDIIKQMKRLWTETITARVPSELMNSVRQEDIDATFVAVDEIADQKLSVIAPNPDIVKIGRDVLSEEEYELLKPLWELVLRDSEND